MQRTIITTILASILLLNVTACNTVAGMGRDIERAGEKVQDVAKKK